MLPKPTVLSHPFLIGIDVGKASLAVFIPAEQRTLTIPNQMRSIRAFIRRYPQASFALEATGGYEKTLILAALAAGNTVYRVNARRVRAFMESRGILAKTDAIDAKAIADFTAANLDALRPFALPDEACRVLSQLAGRRDELIIMRTQERNRRNAPDNKEQHASIDAVLACLQTQIRSIDAAIARRVQSSVRLTQKIAIMTSVKGIGTTTAVAVIAALPEIGTLEGKQITSLAGLAPHPRDSGSKQGYRRTGRGRATVRRALFLAALSAARSAGAMRDFYQRLISHGKKPMQALIAVARKLLVILNAKLRDADLIPA